MTPSPKSEPSGRTTAARPPGSEQTDDEGQKEIGCFARLEMLGKVAFDAVFFFAPEGRIGEDDVHAVGLAIADIGPGQGVVVADKGRVVDAVQEHVGDAEHVRKLFFLAGAQACCMVCSSFGVLT